MVDLNSIPKQPTVLDVEKSQPCDTVDLQALLNKVFQIYQKIKDQL